MFGILLNLAAVTAMIMPLAVKTEARGRTRHLVDPSALWQRLSKYATPGAEKVTKEQVAKAYAAKDEFGVAIALPPIDVLRSEVDTNQDGAISATEAKAWKGYQEKRFCQSTGDRSYGCLDRCLAGIDRANGFAGYFGNYKTETLEGFDMVHDTIVTPSGTINAAGKVYNGQVSRAQEAAIVAALMEQKHKVDGHVAIFGLHYEPLWRSVWSAISDFQNRNVYLFDTFQGEAACDTKHDTAMCPAKGSSKVSEQYVKQDVATYGDYANDPTRKDRVLVYETDYASAGQLIKGKLSFAVVDGRIYPTVKQMLKTLQPHLAPGAIVAVHDFGWEGYPGVEAAVNEFTKSTGFQAILPSSLDGVACYLSFLKKM